MPADIHSQFNGTPKYRHKFRALEVTRDYSEELEMKEKTNPRLKAAIIEVVDNQLKDNDPPFVKATLERLIAKGWSKMKSKEAIAAVLLGDMYYVLRDNVPFDEEQYQRNLDRL